MGMYTELHFNVELKSNTPQHIIDILKYMIGNKIYANESDLNIPDHPLFKTARWDYMLLSNSYSFAAKTISTLEFDGNAGAYFLCIRCNLKNYYNEIEHFIDWIDPYVNADSGDFLGFYRYSETEDPTLIRKK